MVSDEGNNPKPLTGLEQYLRPAAKKSSRSSATNRAIMLDVHAEPHERHAFPYSLMRKASFLGGKRIVIEYMPEKVSIEGIRLEPLYRAILQHRARSVRVNGDARGFGSAMTDSGEPVITRITIDQSESESNSAIT